MEAYNSVVDTFKNICYNTHMDKNIATEKQGIELLYRGVDISNTPFEDVSLYNSLCDELELEQLLSNPSSSKEFNIPQHYKEIDVDEYVKSLVPKANTSENLMARVEQELGLYKARNLFPILQLMIYIVDIMRKNNLVWGVGRGSSVASYVLYLIGIHKIDSIKYNLDIKEFLK